MNIPCPSAAAPLIGSTEIDVTACKPSIAHRFYRRGWCLSERRRPCSNSLNPHRLLFVSSNWNSALALLYRASRRVISQPEATAFPAASSTRQTQRTHLRSILISYMRQ